MRVIKEGSVEKKLTCPNCKAELAYVPSDVIKRVTTEYDGFKDTDYYIVCPCCERKIFIK